MGKKKKLKVALNLNEGSKIKPPTDQVAMENLDYPVFCLKHTHRKYNVNALLDEEKKALADKLHQLSQMTWQNIFSSARHGAGCEKIDKKSLKVAPPSFITADVTHLWSLRFDGMKPMLVHRNRFIMHIIFIDSKFEVYSHS